MKREVLAGGATSIALMLAKVLPIPGGQGRLGFIVSRAYEGSNFSESSMNPRALPDCSSPVSSPSPACRCESPKGFSAPPPHPSMVLGHAAGEADGDRPDALDRLIRQQASLVLSRWRGRARLPLTLDDLVQETWSLLLEQDARVLRAYSVKRGSLARFLRKVVERRLIDCCRSSRKNPWREQPTEPAGLDFFTQSEPSPEERAHHRLLLARVLCRLTRDLGPKGTRALELLFIEGCSASEASAVSGMTHNALHLWKSRIVRAAREMENPLY